MLKRSAVLMVLVLASCQSPAFEDNRCAVLSERRGDGEAPSWPTSQDEQPEAGGPTLTSAVYEFLSEECPTARLTVQGELGEGTISDGGLADSLRLYVASEDDRRRFVDTPRVRIDGNSFEVEVQFCGAYWYARRPGDAAWVHLQDDEGRGSNAQCVVVTAAAGVAVPEAGSGP